MSDVSDTTPSFSLRQLEILLSLSQDIATIRNKVDLLQVIVTKIKPLFNFYDCGILVIDKYDRFHDLAAIHPEIDDSAVNHLLKEQGFYQDKGLPYANSPLKWVIEQIEEAKSPVLFDYTADYTAFSNHSLLETLRTSGYKEAVAGVLKTGGQVFGCFTINYLDQHQAKQVQLSLFQHVIDQLSVAVANILANEEILAREREKSTLLAISNAIATIHDKRKLLKLIFEQVRPLFDFDDIGLSILEADGQFFNDWAAQYTDTLPVDVEAKQIAQYRFPYAGSLIEQAVADVTAAGHPLVYDLTDELAAQWSGEQAVLLAQIADQQKQTLATTLQAGGKILGLLNINTKQAGHYDTINQLVFQAIADQIAVAVANILANEEILEREREKSALLSVCEAIASVRGKEMLLTLIVVKIKPLFNFYDCGLFIFDADKQHLEDLTVSFPTISPSTINQRLADNSAAKFLVAGSPWGSLLHRLQEAGGPLIYKYKEEQPANWQEYVQASVIDQAGYEESMMSLLKIGGETIGVFSINTLQKDFFRAQQYHIFQAICDQLAVAVANILANEDILAREREKATLLSISGAISSTRNATELLTVIRDKVQQLIPFHDTGILIVEPTGQYHYDLAVTMPGWDATEGNKQLYEAGLHRISHPGSYIAHVMQLIDEAQGPIIDDYEKSYEEFDHVFFPIIEKLGYKEGIVAELKSGGNVIGTFWLNSMEKGHFNPDQFSLFQAVADQVAVAVANILANEAIERQLREITTLKKRIEAENVYLQEEVKSLHNFEEIIGTSPALHDCLIKVGMVAGTPSTVLIGGETGTGKELIARAIHNLSERRGKPLIKINCAALPRDLIESELFGHERGAFTGAFDKRIGKFELANGSTLFLDEVGELPLEVQAKLLRAIQEREIERLGGNRVITVDVRIIVATNRDLQREVQAGRFRADLYFRLNVFPITLPPLRERRDDIPVLAAHFVQKSAKKVGKALNGVSTKAMQSLLRYHFPGNIRELEHIIERGAILATGRTIQELHLPTIPSKVPLAGSPDLGIQTLAEQERAYILSVLDHCRGRVSGPDGAARLLGLPASTLESKMKKLGIAKKYQTTGEPS